MYAKTINEQRGHEFEMVEGRVYGRVWIEEEDRK